MRADVERDTSGQRDALRILFVAPYVPSRLRPRPLHFITELAARGHSIDLIAAATSERELAEAPALGGVCRRVRTVRIPAARSVWSCTRGLFGAAPLQARYCLSPAMTAAVRDALGAGAYHVLHVEHLRAALYGLGVAGVPRVYDAVDCMSRLLAQTASEGPTGSSRMTARAELGRTRAFERRLLGAFDRVLVTARSERDALQLLDPAPPPRGGVQVLPNGVDIDYFAPAAAPRDPATVLFVGRMAYHANRAAARELVASIMPRVWAARPDARLLIVGADPHPSLHALAAAAPGPVEVTGYVPDIRPYLARATVSISPLRYAAGIQNKVLEAMAMQTPVVATPAACAALGAVPGKHLLVETTAAALGVAVLRLMDDPGLAQRLGSAARRYVVTEHDWGRTGGALEAIYRDAAEARSRALRNGAHCA